MPLMAAAPLAIEDLIDLPRFAAVNGSPALLAEVAPLFLRQAQAWLVSVESARAARDEAGVLQLLHKMKGSCAALCTATLARDIHAAEQHIRDHGLDASQPLLAAVCEDLRQLNEAMAGLGRPEPPPPSP
jgi:HPt (histidine-containing phosphotransfer) domain-containing protein